MLKFTNQTKEIRNQIPFRIRKMKNHKILLSLCLILALPAIAFLPCLKNDFINWDDQRYVAENKIIMGWSWNNIKSIFNRTYMGHYHPLTLLSYSLEYQFFKLNPLIYHLTNLVLHLMNGLLVFLFIFLLNGEVMTSLMVSLLFGIHPLHVETVAWISERKDVLYSFFFLGSLIVYLRYLKTKWTRYYVLSLSLFFLSLLSKSMAMTLPIVLFLCDYLLHRKFDRKSLIEKIPFLAIAFIFGIMALFTQRSTEIMNPKSSSSLIKNIFIMSEVLTSYFSKLILPIKLSCVYPPMKGMEGSWSYVYLPIIIGILIAGIILGRYNRKIAFGTFFFFATILPVLPIKIVADRYTYIPSTGIFFIAAEGFDWLYRSKVEPQKMVKPILAILLIGILCTFSFLTWERCQVWKDSLSLWSNALKNYPDTPVAYNNLGEAYLRKEDYERAISNYNQALKMNPEFRRANYLFVNRGTAYLMKGDYERAIADYDQALRINPNDANAYHNRGAAYLHKGDPEEAIADFNKAIENNPRYAEAYFNKAIACEKTGDLKGAVEAYRGFIENVPPHFTSYINYARKRIRELSK
jgi:hypothetical protein